MTNVDAGSGTPGRTPRHDRQEGCLDRPREPLPTRVDDLPQLPSAYDAALDASLARLDLALDPGVRRRIGDHLRLLLAWNEAINLSAIRDPAEAAVRHVLDSLAALPLLRERGADALLDLGSGGGYPGLPLALALPARRALLVESIGKKARFLETAVDAVGAGATVRVGRVRAEALATEPGEAARWPIVTARAVASLDRLVELAGPLLAPGGALIAWKRDVPADERAAARQALDRLGGGTIEVRPAGLAALPDHVLVLVTPAPRGGPAGRRRRGSGC